MLGSVNLCSAWHHSEFVVSLAGGVHKKIGAGLALVSSNISLASVRPSIRQSACCVFVSSGNGIVVLCDREWTATARVKFCLGIRFYGVDVLVHVCVLVSSLVV